MRIRPESVRDTLYPVLGSIAMDETLCCSVARHLSGFLPGRTDYLASLSVLQSILFQRLYDLLGERMTLQRPDGAAVRILRADLPRLADLAMRPIWEGLTVCQRSLELLRELAMQEHSVSAMQTLSARYGAYLQEGEKQLLYRIVAENTLLPENGI